jgi:hypothetical protein
VGIVVLGLFAAAAVKLIAPPGHARVEKRQADDGGHRFRTSLEWGPNLDPKGMIRRFPREYDGYRYLPLLLAAFDTSWLMKVILPRAVAAVGERLKEGLKGEDDDETLCRNATHIYTSDDFYQGTNRRICAEVDRLMRLDPDHNQPDAKLWPFVAILQMAFIKGEKDFECGILYNGGLIAEKELDQIREDLAAGQEREIVPRGITFCSRSEKVAAGCAREAKPTHTMARVLY